MNKYWIPAVALAIVGCESPSEFRYPEARTADSVAVYFGDTVADPYGWMEDDYAEATVNWVTAQNELTRNYLDTLAALPYLKEKMAAVWRTERYGLPQKVQGRKYFTYNDGAMNQPVLKQLSGEKSTLVLDPNKLSDDGTAAVSQYSFSKDGKYLAYSVSESGSDWRSIRVMDLGSGEMLDDHVNWVKFSGISWQGNGFYYSAYEAPEAGEEYTASNEYHQVFYHQLGTPQKDDRVVWRDDSHPRRNHYAATSHDEKWVVLMASEGTSGNNVRVTDDGVAFSRVVTTFEDDYSFIGSQGNILYFLTNAGAPNKKVVAYDAQNGGEFKDIIAERPVPLQSAVMSEQFFVLEYMEDVVSRLYTVPIADPAAAPQSIALPGLGTVGGIRTDRKSNEVFVSFENYYTPSQVYRFEAGTDASVAPFFEIESAVDPDRYETLYMTYRSKDSTEIPLFITRKKGVAKSPQTPCFLYGYGGFNIAIQPHFKADRIPFLDDGGIYVVANIRGGSEYGEEWHQQGIKLHKQNVFDDFIAAAEFLQQEGWTSKEKLAVHGRSNGGLLIGAMLTQRPDLFQVAIPKVGVLDMLRYHRFTIGWAWASDYGRSDEFPEMYEYLKGYSPLHNVEKTNYPPTLLVTGDHDDRVVPAHTFKFAATLQAHQQGDAPILMRVDTDAGHGAGKPVSKQIEEFADQWAFVYWHLGVKGE